MADSFFKQRFNAAKCKTLLKLTIPRIKLLRNRREIQLKQMRREIAKLIETGQEATARIRVEHIMREEKMMAAQEIVELFCELIAVRLPIIESQKECPLDLKEAISSVCFAAPRCADLPELLQVQLLFATKYGKEFVSAATELLPECGVNRQLVELLSIRAPAPDLKLELLKEIAEEHQLDWDPSSSENELLKSHEDLLNGPSHFVSGSQVPLPNDKLDQTKDTIPEPPAASHEHTDSDDDFDIVNLPEVPKQQPLHSNKGTASAPEMFPFPDSALSELDNSEESNPLAPEEVVQEKSSAATGPVGDKQFVPFISPPSFPTRAEQNSPPSIPKTRSDNVDLSDILAAARAAAETAERAATAARSAANIAQLRISELVKKRNDDEVSGSTTVANPSHLEHARSDVSEKTDYGSRASTSPTQNDAHVSTVVDEGSVGTNNHHQPQRLPSMDDETYFSYPNLFTSQNSNVSSHSESLRDSK